MIIPTYSHLIVVMSSTCKEKDERGWLNYVHKILKPHHLEEHAIRALEVSTLNSRVQENPTKNSPNPKTVNSKV